MTSGQPIDDLVNELLGEAPIEQESTPVFDKVSEELVDETVAELERLSTDESLVKVASQGAAMKLLVLVDALRASR